MARTRKTGAAAAAPNKKAVEDAAASAAVSTPTLEAPSAAITASAEANQDGRVGVADADATNRDDALSGDPGSAAAVKAEAEAEAEADAGAEADAEAGEVELAFPLRVRVTNFTRMPVQVPSATLEVGPAPAYATTVVRSEQQLQSLRAELEVLAKLNGLGHEAFAVEPEKEEVE